MLERAQGAEVVEVVQAAETGRDLSGAGSDGRLIGLWLHGKSPATKEAYRSDLAKFSDFTESKSLRTVTLADVQEFADFLSGLLAPASQARILAVLKSLFAFGHQVPTRTGVPVSPSRRFVLGVFSSVFPCFPLRRAMCGTGRMPRPGLSGQSGRSKDLSPFCQPRLQPRVAPLLA